MSHVKDFEFKTAVVTVSTSRFKKYGKMKGLDKIPEDDESGKILVQNIPNVVEYILIPDEIEEIRKTVLDLLKDVDVCILTGGTGLSPKDVTIEALEKFFTKKIDGFGEIFRMLSYQEIGFDAILSRATAGVVGDKVIFCLPGSSKAVKLGIKIIQSSLKHILSHVKGLA